MKLGFVGLGKMGGNMVHRIHRDSDHEVVAFDFDADAIERAADHGATAATCPAWEQPKPHPSEHGCNSRPAAATRADDVADDAGTCTDHSGGPDLRRAHGHHDLSRGARSAGTDAERPGQTTGPQVLAAPLAVTSP